MTKVEAIEALTDGHTIYSPEYANEVCKTLGVKGLRPRKFYSDPKGTAKGLTMKKEGSEGVYSLHLSEWVADQFGVADKVGDFYGRGSQARAYASEVAKVLKVK